MPRCDKQLESTGEKTTVSVSYILAAIIALGVLGYILGMTRASSRPAKGETPWHSRRGYYGAFVALWTVLPALLLMALWSIIQPIYVARAVNESLPAVGAAQGEVSRSLTLSTVKLIGEGLRKVTPAEFASIEAGTADAKEILTGKGVPLASAPAPYMIKAAITSNALLDLGAKARMFAGIGLAALGLIFGLIQVRPALRSRNAVEKLALVALALASLVAIMTTVGIVFSMLFETIHFFQLVPAQKFFFGTVWDPRFSAAGQTGTEGQFGLLPLLWGTFYISLVALAVAVPVGLFSAIYMAEYASPRIRGLAKPLLEVLAGIPTIVYGFFALITFGPFLRDLGAMAGLSISATSVLTAGLIMGVMLIPFVSSLSDDIINAVPQSLRDGSYGLGATKSETIKRVILPAALPGIVGAIMLAASRAIGETMIVVLAAGIAANLTLNPFEPVTTITVKIVSQLTGDLEFNSPQTLVAFALGLTLFVFTLCLNVYALYIVRKYREQYD